MTTQRLARRRQADLRTDGAGSAADEQAVTRRTQIEPLEGDRLFEHHAHGTHPMRSVDVHDIAGRHVDRPGIGEPWHGGHLHVAVIAEVARDLHPGSLAQHKAVWGGGW